MSREEMIVRERSEMAVLWSVLRGVKCGAIEVTVRIRVRVWFKFMVMAGVDGRARMPVDDVCTQC